MIKKNTILSVTLLILLVFLWEMIIQVWVVPSWFLPAPSAIIQELFHNPSLFLDHLLPTLLEATLGLGFAFVVGVSLAGLLSYSPRMHAIVSPLLVLSQTIPTIVLAPLFAIWFGFGIVSKILVVTLTCFFPITISTLDGFSRTPLALERLFSTYTPTLLQYYRYLKVPYALPSLIAGCRIALTYSIMGALLAEWFGGEKGLGILLIRSAKSYNTVRVFAVVFIVTLFTLFIVWLFDKITFRAKSWAEPIDER